MNNLYGSYVKRGDKRMARLMRERAWVPPCPSQELIRRDVLFNGSCRFDKALFLNRMDVTAQSWIFLAHYVLIADGRPVRKTQNAGVAWNWLALKLGLPTIHKTMFQP